MTDKQKASQSPYTCDMEHSGMSQVLWGYS